MLRQLVCDIIGHRINRHRVWHDGMNMRATCRVCRSPMLRARSGWRAFDSNRDADSKRAGHPRST